MSLQIVYILWVCNLSWFIPYSKIVSNISYIKPKPTAATTANTFSEIILTVFIFISLLLSMIHYTLERDLNQALCSYSNSDSYSAIFSEMAKQSSISLGIFSNTQSESPSIPYSSFSPSLNAPQKPIPPS